MTNTQSTILSSNQIHRLHHTFFVPTGKIIATLLIVHGMSEHSGRYAKFAQFLADHGVLVLTYDQLGHGQTVKDKYELGFIDEKHPVQALCKDVVVAADALKAKAVELGAHDFPHFIMGHSMGSFVVRTVLIHHATSFDGAILMGTGNHDSLITKGMGAYLVLANYLRPKQRNDRIANALNNYLLAKLRSPISPSPFAWLAENIDTIKAFEVDELCGFAFSNNGFLTLQTLIQKASGAHWHAHLAPNFPILLISGKDDPVGDMGQDILDLQHELLMAGKLSTSVILYPNMRHEILHEKEHNKVFDDITQWINAHSLS